MKWFGLTQNRFARSVGVLTGGTAAAQAISVLALPVLTRLYSPEEYGVLAVYSAIVGIVAAVACLRLEIAIPLPEKDTDAANLLAIALTSAGVFSLVTALVLALAHGYLARLAHLPGIAPYWWLVPVGIWVAASYTAIQFWTTRQRDFMAIARTRLTQATGGVGTQLLAGWFGIGPLGLLLGQIIKSGAGIISLSRKALRTAPRMAQAVNLRDMAVVLKAYGRFPKYSMLESFANVAGIQLPILLIASHGGGKETGYVMLAMQVMSVPIALLGSSIAQVFLAHAPEHLRQGDLAPFTARTVAGLTKVGLGPLLFAGIVAPTVFPLLFGPEWRRAGELMAWMTPWFMAQFITSPVSMVLHVRNQQRAAFLLQVFGLFLRVGSVVAAGWYFRQVIPEAYALSGFVFYLLYFLVVKRIAGFDFAVLFKGVRTLPAIAGVWALAGIFVAAAGAAYL